jgi:hypothetical protein
MNVGLPERFDVDERSGGLRIHWKWPAFMAIPLAFFSLAWDSFLVFWYFGVARGGDASLVEWLFPLGHVAIGLILPYVAVAFWVNSTFVEVKGAEITVTHRPLPFPGNRRLQVMDVHQFFCVERARQKGSPTYAVMARLASGKEVTLVSGLTSDREARFLEERIEQRIGLGNQPVTGELPTTPVR